MNQKEQASEAEIIRILVEDLAEHPNSRSANLNFHYSLLEIKDKEVSNQHIKKEALLDEEQDLNQSTTIDEERFLVKNRIRQLLGWGLKDE